MGDFAVAPGLAVWHGAEYLPDLLPERRALGSERQIELPELASEIGVELFFGLAGETFARPPGVASPMAPNSSSVKASSLSSMVSRPIGVAI